MASRKPMIIFKLKHLPLQGRAWVSCPSCKTHWSFVVQVQDEPSVGGGSETSAYVLEQLCSCKLSFEELAEVGRIAEATLRGEPDTHIFPRGYKVDDQT